MRPVPWKAKDNARSSALPLPPCARSGFQPLLHSPAACCILYAGQPRPFSPCKAHQSRCVWPFGSLHRRTRCRRTFPPQPLPCGIRSRCTVARPGEARRQSWLQSPSSPWVSLRVLSLCKRAIGTAMGFRFPSGKSRTSVLFTPHGCKVYISLNGDRHILHIVPLTQHIVHKVVYAHLVLVSLFNLPASRLTVIIHTRLAESLTSANLCHLDYPPLFIACHAVAVKHVLVTLWHCFSSHLTQHHKDTGSLFRIVVRSLGFLSARPHHMRIRESFTNGLCLRFVHGDQRYSTFQVNAGEQSLSYS